MGCILHWVEMEMLLSVTFFNLLIIIYKYCGTRTTLICLCIFITSSLFTLLATPVHLTHKLLNAGKKWTAEWVKREVSSLKKYFFRKQKSPIRLFFEDNINTASQGARRSSFVLFANIKTGIQRFWPKPFVCKKCN